MIDTNDNTVTVCMDYIKGRCMREKCKYFHPPAHLQAKIKAAQHQANQAAVAAQAAAAAATVMVSGAHLPRTFLRCSGLKPPLLGGQAGCPPPWGGRGVASLPDTPPTRRLEKAANSAAPLPISLWFSPFLFCFVVLFPPTHPPSFPSSAQ